MICVNMDASRTAIQEAATETRTSMDLRERLALDLLGASYTQLTEQKRSVIDHRGAQRPDHVMAGGQVIPEHVFVEPDPQVVEKTDADQCRIQVAPLEEAELHEVAGGA